LSIKIK